MGKDSKHGRKGEQKGILKFEGINAGESVKDESKREESSHSSRRTIYSEIKRPYWWKI